MSENSRGPRTVFSEDQLVKIGLLARSGEHTYDEIAAAAGVSKHQAQSVIARFRKNGATDMKPKRLPSGSAFGMSPQWKAALEKLGIEASS